MNALLSFWPIVVYVLFAYDYELNLDEQNVDHIEVLDIQDYHVDNGDQDVVETIEVLMVYRIMDKAIGNQLAYLLGAYLLNHSLMWMEIVWIETLKVKQIVACVETVDVVLFHSNVAIVVIAAVHFAGRSTK